jgi:hypothetical protein
MFGKKPSRISALTPVQGDRRGRRRLVALVCLAGLALLPHAAAQATHRLTSALPPKEKRFALLIGVGTYENGIKPLKGPTNDVALLKDALAQYAGFPRGNIFTLSSDSSDPHEKPTVTNIVRLVGQELKPKLTGGLLLVAFSGHGINKAFQDGKHIENVPLLLMYDSSLSPDYLLEKYALPVTKLRALLETADASQVVLFIDACQDDPDPSKPLADNPMTQQFVSDMQFRRHRLDGSLVFFATRPPLRAYVGPHDRGYFTEAVVEALQGAADKDQRKYTTLDHFLDYVHAAVVSETKGRQNPKESHYGYDLPKLKIVDRTSDVTSSPGMWHKIVVRHAGTESACAKLPSDAKLLVTVGQQTSTVESEVGCEVSYFLPDTVAGATAHITLASARGVVVDSATTPQDRGAATWIVDVHYNGPAVRISQFDINLSGMAATGFDYRRVLNDQVWVLAGLLSAQDETKYANRLILVDTGRVAKPPLVEQLDYLDRTNSVESLWGEAASGANGAPELHLHALVRPGANMSGLVSAKLAISDSVKAYQKVNDVTRALILLGLLEDAKRNNHGQAAKFLANSMLQILEPIEHLEELSPDLASVKHALEAGERRQP